MCTEKRMFLVGESAEETEIRVCCSHCGEDITEEPIEVVIGHLQEKCS